VVLLHVLQNIWFMETHLYVICIFMQIHLCGFSQEETLQRCYTEFEHYFMKPSNTKWIKTAVMMQRLRVVQQVKTSRKLSFLFIHFVVTRFVLLHASLVLSECTIFRECYWLLCALVSISHAWSRHTRMHPLTQIVSSQSVSSEDLYTF